MARKQDVAARSGPKASPPQDLFPESMALTEIERQEECIKQLPANFEFPLFNTRFAIESMRDNGYRNTSTAAAELVDNALQAGATRVDILFGFDTGDSKPDRIAFVDNGAGMIPRMMRFALTWGGGSHFGDRSGFGRFGFGLPNSSVNQTRHAIVYSRTKPEEKWWKTELNLDATENHVPQPVQADLPRWVVDGLGKVKSNVPDHGSIVIWEKPDRLTWKTKRTLTEHLLEEFGILYRNFIQSHTITIDGITTGAVDPLFLDPLGRYYLPPDKGGAQEMPGFAIPFEYEPGKTSNIKVRVSRLPIGFAVGSGTTTPEQKARNVIRSNNYGMSFVRAGREIEVFRAFPQRKSSEFGEWPSLQSYSYHWGCEVSFEPALDDLMGISNNKQSVRPSEEFWRLLAKAGVDKALRAENAYQEEHRKKTATKESTEAAEKAMEKAVELTKRKAAPSPEKQEEAKANAEKVIEEEVKAGKPREVAVKELQEKPFKILSEDLPGATFFRPERAGSQIRAYLNRAHPFFKEFYGKAARTPGCQFAKDALDVFILTLAKAEADAEGDVAKMYRFQREHVWSGLLGVGIEILTDMDPIGKEIGQSDANS